MSVDDAATGRPDPGGPADPIQPIVAVVAAAGDLDDESAKRLLRCCEVRLHLLDIGRLPVTDIVVDLSHVHRAAPSALAILDHARVEAKRRHVGIHLVGARAVTAHVALPACRYLALWATFPSLDAARAALQPVESNADRSSRRSVDPDSITIPAMRTEVEDRTSIL